MTQVESHSIREGMFVEYLGVKCKIITIQIFGNQYHPYFRLVPNEETTKHKMKTITGYGISYVLCERIES
jgi:hypothetical protein